MSYAALLITIMAEMIGTSSLKMSDGFTRLIPWGLVSIISYVVAYYCFSIALKAIPIGIAYGVWSGVGTAVITIVGFVWFHQMLDELAIFGLVLIVVGLVIIHWPR